ncbi:hypothetical protein BJ742DRAFT_246052 [Cladochytrium replicatum]|nr:hypothetical protein BJ742DRAFT_246052 [Cladochytrium replicatum]
MASNQHSYDQRLSLSFHSGSSSRSRPASSQLQRALQLQQPPSAAAVSVSADQNSASPYSTSASPDPNDSPDDTPPELLLVPRKRVGRKPALGVPEDKRIAQNRAAQRAFRERKNKYVRELEAKIKQLEREKKEALEIARKLRGEVEESEGSSSTPASSTEVSGADPCEDEKNAQLRKRLKALEEDNEMLKEQLSVQQKQVLAFTQQELHRYSTSSLCLPPIHLHLSLPAQTLSHPPHDAPSDPLALPAPPSARHHIPLQQYNPQPAALPLAPPARPTGYVSLSTLPLTTAVAPQTQSLHQYPSAHLHNLPEPEPVPLVPLAPLAPHTILVPQSLQPSSVPPLDPSYLDLPTTLVYLPTSTTVPLAPLYPTLLADFSAPLDTRLGIVPAYFDVPRVEPSPWSHAPFQPNPSTDASPLTGFSAADMVSIARWTRCARCSRSIRRRRR